eukprot:5568157-Heterocapsa_arctica.AAC.1
MNAGALHTIIIDGVWYPERANKRGKTMMGFVCSANAEGKEDSNTFGGNANLAIQSQIIAGCSCGRSRNI